MIGPIIVMGFLFGLLMMFLFSALYILRNPNLKSVDSSNLGDTEFENDDYRILRQVTDIEIGAWNDEFSSIDDYEYGIDIKDD